MASGLVGHCVDVVQDWQQPLLGNLPVKEGQVGGETQREEGIKGKIKFRVNFKVKIELKSVDMVGVKLSVKVKGIV